MVGQFEVARGGYAEDEVLSLYALGRHFIESGNLRGAETIFRGLTVVEPTFISAWIGLSFVALHRQNFDESISAAKQALRMDQDRAEALIYLVTAYLEIGDRISAGTHLGELQDHVQAGRVGQTSVRKIFEGLLVRLSS